MKHALGLLITAIMVFYPMWRAYKAGYLMTILREVGPVLLFVGIFNLAVWLLLS